MIQLEAPVDWSCRECGNSQTYDSSRNILYPYCTYCSEDSTDYTRIAEEYPEVSPLEGTEVPAGIAYWAWIEEGNE